MLEIVTALYFCCLRYSLCLPVLEIVTALFLFFIVLALFTGARGSHRTVLVLALFTGARGSHRTSVSWHSWPVGIPLKGTPVICCSLFCDTHPIASSCCINTHSPVLTC